MNSIIELLVPKGRRRPGDKLEANNGVVIHNTGNAAKGATAENNALWQQNTPSYETSKGTTASWHLTVGETENYLSIPIDEVAYHCGRSKGNKSTVGIEIPMNSDGDLLKVTDNAAELAAYVLIQKGFTKAVWKENIWQHHDWSGKNCPEKIRVGEPYDWTTFVAKVNTAMKNMLAGTATETVTSTATKTTVVETFVITKILRRGRNNDAAQVRVIQQQLKNHGYSVGSIDGIFGPVTEKAVKAFQYDFKLTVDGIVGAQTTVALGGTFQK